MIVQTTILVMQTVTSAYSCRVAFLQFSFSSELQYCSDRTERLSSASSRPLTSALVDVPTPDQQFYRESLVAWERSCDQILVHQPFARRAVHEAVEPQQRVATLPSLSRKVNSSTYRPRCFGLTWWKVP